MYGCYHGNSDQMMSLLEVKAIPDTNSTGDGTQGFVHVSQILYQLSYNPAQNLSFKVFSTHVRQAWWIVLSFYKHEAQAH